MAAFSTSHITLQRLTINWFQSVPRSKDTPDSVINSNQLTTFTVNIKLWYYLSYTEITRQLQQKFFAVFRTHYILTTSFGQSGHHQSIHNMYKILGRNFMLISPCIVNQFWRCSNKMALFVQYFIPRKQAYVFRVKHPPIIRSSNKL
jgi:hypothetical protein